MIDFNFVKEVASIEEVAITYLNLKAEKSNGQYRCACPGCAEDNPRAMVITPSKGLFYCFNSQKGGDVIALVAHVKDLSMKEAAQYILDFQGGYEQQSSIEEAKKETATVSKGFDPAKYAEDLDAESVSEVGVSPELCKEVGWMGIAPKGINKGKLTIPLRAEDGSFIDFIGVEGVSVPKRWRVK